MSTGERVQAIAIAITFDYIAAKASFESILRQNSAMDVFEWFLCALAE